MWIATQSGLNRFDGTSFNTFSSEYQNEKCGSYINALVADHKKIWIGTRAAGLCYFDKAAYHFSSIQPLQNFNIEDMVMDVNGHLFVTLENRGVGFISNDTSGYKVHFINYFSGKNITATSLFIDQNQTLWVGTKEGILFYRK